MSVPRRGDPDPDRREAAELEEAVDTAALLAVLEVELELEP